MQFFGLIALSLYLFTTGEFARATISATFGTWFLAILAALLNMVSGLALYRAFEVGIISVVSPIGASYGAITVILSLLSGEVLSLSRGIGIVVAFVGVLLASTPANPFAAKANDGKKEISSQLLPPGVAWALVAAVCFGFTFWILGFWVTPVIGGTVSVWLARLTTIITLFLIAPPLRQTVQFPLGKVWWYIAGVGVLDTAAFVANNIGLTTGQVAIVTILASLFTAVTVILAAIFLRDRLKLGQWLGIGVIFVGIALVSL